MIFAINYVICQCNVELEGTVVVLCAFCICTVICVCQILLRMSLKMAQIHSYQLVQICLHVICCDNGQCIYHPRDLSSHLRFSFSDLCKSLVMPIKVSSRRCYSAFVKLCCCVYLNRILKVLCYVPARFWCIDIISFWHVPAGVHRPNIDIGLQSG